MIIFNPDRLPQTIKVGKMELLVERQTDLPGDLSEIYECSYEKEPESHHGGTRFDRLIEEGVSGDKAILKVTSDVLDNDLAENEIEVLKKLYPESAKDEKFFRYFVRPLADFRLTIKGEDHQAVVFPYLDGYVSMADVLKAFPNGLDFRDVVWMYKRLLVGLGFAHTRGFVHGAIIPTHVMVHPVAHGGKIIDWSYARSPGEKVPSMNLYYEKYYAPEILNRETVVPGTDLFMATKCAVALMGGSVETNEMPDSVPTELQLFLKEALDPLKNMRPENAWDLHEELDQLLQKLVGKPSYRRLDMPSRSL